MADGNTTLLLKLSADVSSLEKQFKKGAGIVDSGSRAMEKRAQQASSNLEKYFGKTDIGKGIDKIFDSSRLRIFDSATARIGLTGSALESLGPAGLAAAAAIGAVGLAFAGAREAAKFADDINDTAARLHVTTDALQEYRYAARLAGGDQKAADEALESFSANLGKAQEGLKKGQRAFLALGFTKEQIKGFADADTALKAVTQRIQGLPNQQKDAIIQQLGLDGLKPLIEAGADEMSRLRDEAHKVGIVMDSELVKRGGELNDKFETIQQVISVQLKSALVDLGPTLVYLLQKLADFAKLANEIVDSFKAIKDRQTDALKATRDYIVERDKDPIRRLIKGGQDQKTIADIDAELARRAAEPKTPPKTTHTLIDQSKTPAGPRDDTAQREDSVAAAVAAADRARLQALGALTNDLLKRADFEKQALAAQTAEENARIDKQIDEIKADKGISQATKDRLSAQLELVKVENGKTAAAKAELIDRDAITAVADRQIEVYTDIINAQIDQLQAEADIATTAQQRLAIEKRILELRQGLEKDLHDIKTERAVKTGELTPEQGAQEKSAFGTKQTAEQSQFALANENPVQKYLRSIQDLNTEFQEASVSAVKDLSDGLADAIVNAKDLGDVAKSVFRQLIAQLLSAAIQKDIAGPLLSLIPGFADGTSYAPGGLAIVGERGRELVNLPKGSQVIPHSQTLEALRGMSVPQGGAQVIIQQNLYPDFRGAVVTQDLIDGMRAYSRQAASAAAGGALKTARKGYAATARQLQLLGTV